MMKSVPCKLHRVHSCRDCHWTPAERMKANLPGGVAMDSAAVVMGLPAHNHPSIVGKSKAEIRNFFTDLGLAIFVKHAQPENIANVMGMFADRKPVAMDAAPLSNDDCELILQAIQSVRKPARRVTPVGAFDAYGNRASHKMAVNRPGELESSESLNDLYTRLKEENRNGYKYEF